MEMVQSGEELNSTWIDLTDFHREKTRCIHHFFEDASEQHRDDVALVYEGNSLTYGALNEQANRLAHYLIERGVGPDSLVGISLERSVEMFVAILGVWKAGGAYVPIDPKYPASRIAYLLENSEVEQVITQRETVEKVKPEAGEGAAVNAIILDAEEVRAELAKFSSENPGPRSGGENLAYMIYTSGSTGLPKGVLIEHRSVLNFFDAFYHVSNYEPSGQRHKALHVSSISFDASVKQMVHLVIGSELHVLSEERRLDPQLFGNYLEEHDIDSLEITPSQLKLLLPSLQRKTFKKKLHVFTVGEAVDKSLWNALESTDFLKCINTYGPAECTVTTTVAPIASSQYYPNIGRTLVNTACYILDEKRNPVAEGQAGEIYISGMGLARGYYKREDLTRERFVEIHVEGKPVRAYRTGDRARWFPDGTIEFLGRVDNQVKIRGFRVELGEIERVLQEDERVRDAVVIADGEGDQKRLIAYLIAQREADRADESGLLAAVKERLTALLPNYMVPSLYKVLERFPLNPNGKVDRKAMPPVVDVSGGVDYVAPRDEVETLLAGIWAEVLGVAQLGIDDDFFDLGGQSLSAVKMINTLRSSLEVDVSVKTIFNAPTVREFAAAIQKTRSVAG